MEPRFGVCYFGNAEEGRASGHNLYGPGMYRIKSSVSNLPWSLGEIDGKLAPKDAAKNKMPQGICRMYGKDGWTVIAFWDRSGDSRANSNSAFFAAYPDATFRQMVERFKLCYPEIFARLERAGITLTLMEE